MGQKCKDSGDIRVFSLDVDKEVLRNEEGDIPFSDPRLRCQDLPEGRSCEFLCILADDLEEIPITVID